MRRLFPLLLTALALLLPIAAQAQTEEQSLVDRATLSVQEMLSDQSNPDARNLLRNATGVMLCPRVFKAGFILGGQGGSCVLVGRGQAGWTSPAFYGLASGSVGFQIGVQDSQIIFIIRTEKGLKALMNSQFKFGADAGVAVATIGAGVAGATTAALRADIVAFAKSRGLYAGISLDGSIISQRSDWNAAYYGQPLSPQQIVLAGQGRNPGAEPLREMLARFSGGR
ncbi:MAG TPA: lipid-binding SYLF domain-containing protein [Acetobacteraceae bacterium]|jgi:lipid-binding SYLF domain-containing protein|nr:lipid-binding SYLF domain-containing protein [Acetobacteraceae bacterium]